MNKYDNLFIGVNPLLMSHLQAQDDFLGFHNFYLVKLIGHLHTTLSDDYIARLRPKLTLYHEGDKFVRYSDIFRSRGKDFTPLDDKFESSPNLFIWVGDFITKTTDWVVSIDSVNDNLPIIIIDLLSPINKLGGKDSYLEKRKGFLQTELILVEIDFFHHPPSPIDNMPVYPYYENSSPYYIAVTHPLDGARTAVYQFGINQPIPKIRLPLLDGDSIVCDFDAVYQTVFVGGRYMMDINYANAPMDLGAYSTSDQTKILSHLATIQNNP